MIKYLKSNPVGIDVFISMFQNMEQRVLPGVFSVLESRCLFYGRGEVKDDEVIIYSTGKDYESLKYDDKYDLVTYLVLNDLVDYESLLARYSLSFYCHGDLTKLFTSITHRADEEFRLAMKHFLSSMIEPQDITSLEIIKSLQPYHSFKINFYING